MLALAIILIVLGIIFFMVGVFSFDGGDGADALGSLLVIIAIILFNFSHEAFESSKSPIQKENERLYEQLQEMRKEKQDSIEKKKLYKRNKYLKRQIEKIK